MKNLLRVTVTALIPCLFLQGCTNLGDDAFAHSVKSGNSRSAIATIQPGQERLHIYERDGRWYYPIHYTIVRGESESTFSLIRQGSPTRLDGRSLAYNAARINHTSLARELASSGYGSHSDIAQALADNRRERQRRNEANAAGAALAVVVLATLLSSSPGSGRGGSDDEDITYSPYSGEPMGKFYYR